MYLATKTFPKEEIYGLTAQIRRAVLSIPTNIVEGYSRKGDKELARFLNISLGSLAESKYLLYFASTLEYLTQDKYESLMEEMEEIGSKLWSFYQKVAKG